MIMLIVHLYNIDTIAGIVLKYQYILTSILYNTMYDKTIVPYFTKENRHM